MVVIGRELDDEEVPDEFPDVGHVPSNERNSFEELQVPSNERQRFVEESESRQELLERLGRLLSAPFFCCFCDKIISVLFSLYARTC